LIGGIFAVPPSLLNQAKRSLRHPDVSLETAVNEVFAQLGIPAN
jgi:hypothetical protein